MILAGDLFLRYETRTVRAYCGGFWMTLQTQSTLAPEARTASPQRTVSIC